ncbi:MAG: aminomethyl-transferring glycine dehydrogenase subunit GcvPA [Thermoplasmata archaeon]|nr:MAG: aminomethyl-transferring glycine dehydrogenase subunit GcvPA [Thermoplasmata archaeon]
MPGFIPNVSWKNDMLKSLGLSSIDELFSDIPEKIRIDKLNLPKGLSQQEVERELSFLADKNISCKKLLSFLGGGVKPHYIPAIVKSIISRSEFYTAYTPYQPEASQGFLQAMFEYQSMIAELTGMEVANASMYDAATSLGEAALMSTRITHEKCFLIPENISWERKSVLHNYVKGTGIEVKEIRYNRETGGIDLDDLKKNLDDTVSGVYLENPNFFGIIEEEIYEIQELIEDRKTLFVVGIDPISLGILKPPGEYNADIVIGEGRALGNPMDFGGSSLGIFACKKKYIRQMPGRIIGLTKDINGNRAFCMTLQTREQHIRRGKATSNICTNNGLNALAALVYITWLGSDGFYDISRRNFENGQKLMEILLDSGRFERIFTGIHFNEFVLRYKGDVSKFNTLLLEKGIHSGLPLEAYFPELKKTLLFGVTEVYGEDDFNRLYSAIMEVS